MNKHTRYCLLLAAGLAFGAARPAAAQADNKVYTYVELMPQLPGGGGNGAIQAAIKANFRLPADALASHLQGTIFLIFNVDPTGQVADARVLQGLTPSTDAAALAAVRSLPRFKPGQQNGRPVTVSLTIPLRLVSDAAGNALSSQGNKLGEDEVVENKVYTYVEQMPQLPGGGGQQAIVVAVQQRLVVPPGAVEGRAFASFTVSATGAVQDARIVKGLSASVDAAVLAAIQKLPTFVPGKQNGRAVAVSFTVPVTIYLPNHVFDLSQVGTRARFPQPGLAAYAQRHLQVPPVVASEKLHGLVGVDFVVLASGKIDSPTLTSHLCGACDAEVLRFVQSLPAWLPAHDRAGQAVAVRQHLDVPLPFSNSATPYEKPEKLYTYVSQQATLLDGTPLSELGTLLTQTIHYTEVARREKITGNAQVEFVVDANGIVREPRITQSVCSSCDQSIIDALVALGPLVPGRQAGQSVATQVTLSVPFNPTLAAPAGK